MRIVIFLLILLASPAFASGAEYGIAAVVGNEAVTSLELKNRVDLAIASSGLAGNDEVRKKLTPQILQMLINEKLQMREARELNISVADAEIERAITSLEQQNRLNPGGIDAFLKVRNINKAVLVEQIKGQITWAKIVAKKIQPKINVSDDEITEFMASQSGFDNATELLLSEIVLPVDSPEDEDRVKALAIKLSSEIRGGKAGFATVARQFSQSSTAAAGGEVGWVPASQLPAELGVALGRVKQGEATEPVRSIEGYYILKLQETRSVDYKESGENEVVLKQLAVPLKPRASDGEIEQAFTRAENVRAEMKGCSNFASVVKKYSLPNLDFGRLKVKDLNENVRKVVSRLKVGVPSSPIKTDRAIFLFVVCERVEDKTPSPAAARNETRKEDVRARAETAISRRKLELEARKYMRNLRKSANVEIRL